VRVVHVDTEPSWRGGERQALLLAKGLIGRGHACSFVAPPGSAVLDRCEQSGVTIQPLRMRAEWDPMAVAGLTRLFRSLRPDIVHTHSGHAHLLSALACSLSSRGLCVVSRRVDFPIGPISARLKYRYGVGRFVAITRAVAEVLEGAGVPRRKISVVHSGIDPAELASSDRDRGRAALGVAGDVPVVGALCHLARHKGLIHLVRAWPSVVAERPEARLVIAGQGEEAARLHEAASAGGVLDSVTFAGFRDDVPDCLAAFDLFVQPSLMEGLNTTILDALALERTVLASRVGGIPEVVEHGKTGWLVPPRDPPAIAAGILGLLEDRELAAKLARAGRDRVLREFTAERMVKQTEGVYRAALAEGRGEE